MVVHDDNESGILVYPQLPVPKARREEPRMSIQRERRGRRLPIVAIVVSALAGGAGAWFLQPVVAPDSRIADAARRASEAESAAATQKSRADALDKSLADAASARRDADSKLAAAAGAEAELASHSADAAGQRKAAEVVAAKLRPVIDRSVASIVVESGEVHVRIASGALFKPNDDALIDRGRAMLGKLGAAVKEMPDQQLSVQGHTDDAPVPLPRPVPAPPPARGARVPAPPPPPAAVVRFPTNWELSSARALAVVHYLQDVTKLEPSRLAALAFGQYAPLSKKDKSVNRRIEIVIAAARQPGAVPTAAK
jgi:chemotaxis protein MotB